MEDSQLSIHNSQISQTDFDTEVLTMVLKDQFNAKPHLFVFWPVHYLVTRPDTRLPQSLAGGQGL